jgi:O-antigen/teichoic acid export membrane protein
MTLSSTILRNVTVTFAGRIYSGLFTFAVVALLLPRVLSREGFGIYAFYNTLFVILGVVIDFGANTIAVREGSRDQSRLGALLNSLALLRLILSCLCFAAAAALAFVFEESGRARLLVIAASLHLLFHSLGGFAVVFHVRMKFSLLVLSTVIGQTCFFAAVVTLFCCGREEPLAYLFAFGGGLAVSNTVSFLIARRFVPCALRSEGGDLLRLVRESFPLGISAILSILYFYVDTILLRFFRGEGDVGLYNAAYRLLSFAILFSAFFSQVLLPVFSRFAHADPTRFRRVLKRSVLYMGVLSLPVTAGLAVLSEPVLRLIFPAEYGEAADCLALLGIAVAFIFVASPHVFALIAAGRQVTFTLIALCGLVVNVLLNLTWIPSYGIEGAAWATVVTEGFVLAAAVLCVRKQLGFWTVSSELISILPVTGAVCGAAWLFRDAPMALLLPCLALLFVGALYLFRLLPFNIGDEDRN